MEIVKQPVEYKDGDTVLEGLLCFNKALTNGGNQLPTVLVCHAWAGRAPIECQKAEGLAKLGYAGFAVDLFGKGIVGSGPEENQKLMQPFVEDRPGLLLRRLDISLKTALAQSVCDNKKVAAIGFCFGGLCVLDMARNDFNLLGVVSFHGLFNPADGYKTKKLNCKVMALHGYKDPMVPPDAVMSFMKEMSDSECDWQFHAYGTAGHAFTNKSADSYGFPNVAFEKNADIRSWQSMVHFLEELFA